MGETCVGERSVLISTAYRIAEPQHRIASHRIASHLFLVVWRFCSCMIFWHDGIHDTIPLCSKIANRHVSFGHNLLKTSIPFQPAFQETRLHPMHPEILTFRLLADAWPWPIPIPRSRAIAHKRSLSAASYQALSPRRFSRTLGMVGCTTPIS